jgi:hypothetical protein
MYICHVCRRVVHISLITLMFSLYKMFIFLLSICLSVYPTHYQVRDINPVGSDLFYWSFYVVVVFLLLNMTTSIVFNSHYEVIQKFNEQKDQEDKQRVVKMYMKS